MRILVAIDGSSDARAAVAWLGHLPLPAGQNVKVLTAVLPPIAFIDVTTRIAHRHRRARRLGSCPSSSRLADEHPRAAAFDTPALTRRRRTAALSIKRARHPGADAQRRGGGRRSRTARRTGGRARCGGKERPAARGRDVSRQRCTSRYDRAGHRALRDRRRRPGCARSRRREATAPRERVRGRPDTRGVFGADRAGAVRLGSSEIR